MTKNKFIIAALWLLEITQVRIGFRNYLFQTDKRISHIQNLSGGYNINPDNVFVELLSEFDFANYSIRSIKVFSIFRLFIDDKTIAQG
jgi:hypothetical protein